MFLILFFLYIQDCYPVRTKSLDFVNAPPHVNVVLNIFRQFMTEKLRQRVSTKLYNDTVLLPWCRHIIDLLYYCQIINQLANNQNVLDTWLYVIVTHNKSVTKMCSHIIISY